MGIFVAILFALASGASGEHASQEETFLGLRLGVPLSPECESESDGSAEIFARFNRHVEATYTYKLHGSNRPCWMDLGGPKRSGDAFHGDGLVRIDADSPRGVGEVWASVMDGNVESITAVTDGWKSQDTLFNLLSEKYGEPESKVVTPMQSALGVQVDGIHAVWVLHNFRVVFSGISEQIHKGSIGVYTEKGFTEFERKYGKSTSF